MQIRVSPLLIVSQIGPLALLIASCAAAPDGLPRSNTKRTEGYASPVDVFNASRAALSNRDWRTYFACLTPDRQKDAIFETVFALGLSGSPKAAEISKTYISNDPTLELDYAVRYKEKHGLDAKVQSDREVTGDVLFARVRDKAGFYEAAHNLLIHDLPPVGELRNVKIDGDTATGVADGVIVSIESEGNGQPERRVESKYERAFHFRRIDGNWLIDLP